VSDVNAGIYVLEPRLVARLPRNEEVALPTLISDGIALGDLVRTYEIRDDWIDVGQKEHLAEARGGFAYVWGV
jgi:NDP-sugar pyrophosphorylase family protein